MSIRNTWRSPFVLYFQYFYELTGFFCQNIWFTLSATINRMHGITWVSPLLKGELYHVLSAPCGKGNNATNTVTKIWFSCSNHIAAVLWTLAQLSSDVLPTCFSVWQQITKSRHTQAYAELIRCNVTAT